MSVNLQHCLSYLNDIDFDRDTLARAREELASVTQRANSALPAPSLMTPYTPTANDVDRAVRLAWNEAIEEAATACLYVQHDVAWMRGATKQDVSRAAARQIEQSIRALRRPA